MRHALLAFCLVLSGCGLIDKIFTNVNNVVGDASDLIDDTMEKMTTESQNWRALLEEMSSKMTDDVRELIGNDIENLIATTVATGGVEFRCNADFIAEQMRDALIAIKAKILGQDIPEAQPALCQVVPLALDMAVIGRSVKTLDFFGYNLKRSDKVKVYHLTSSGKNEITHALDRPTEYAMTLNLGPNGVRLTNRSQRIQIEFDRTVVSSVAVIQEPTPVCKTRTIRTAAQEVTLIPPKTRGDGDFSGNGPRIRTVVKIANDTKRVRAKVYMQAKETKKDWTTAEGSKTYTLYSVDEGYRIDGIASSQVVQQTHQYTDNDHEDDRANFGAGGPVQRMVHIGDTGGSEAGSRTKVDVKFNPIQVILRETGDCVSESTVNNLINRPTLISPNSLRRFSTELRARNTLQQQPGIQPRIDLPTLQQRGQQR